MPNYYGSKHFKRIKKLNVQILVFLHLKNKNKTKNLNPILSKLFFGFIRKEYAHHLFEILDFKIVHCFKFTPSKSNSENISQGQNSIYILI